MLKLFFSARRSWIDGLYDRSYRMQMGELHLPGVHLYMVNDPAVVKRVLQEESADFPKSALLGDALRPLLGESVFTTNGAMWRRQRDMMNPAFAQARLQVAFPVMKDAADDMLKRLASLPDGAEHDVEVEMTFVTADIIFRTIFSKPLAGPDAHRVFEAFARFQALAPKLMLPAMYAMRWLVWPWDVWRSRRAAREIRGLLEALIRPRFEAYQRDGVSLTVDILAAFMAARDPQTGRAFSFDELVDQVAMLFLAGHETSASALTWACYLLAKAPDVQERVKGELSARLQGRSVEQSDLKQLELTWNVFRETLRLFPPVGFMVRESAKACTLRDKAVPQGASVLISPWLIQRHRLWWQEPDAFNPDRYQDEKTRESLRTAYLPFGEGPRVCIGAAFALQEAVLILASLVGSFLLEAVPGHVPQPVGRLTIRSGNGVRLKLHRRPEE
ncbi:MAG: cytochrome P450 [Pseudomonadota bacterium]